MDASCERVRILSGRSRTNAEKIAPMTRSQNEWPV